MVTWSQKEEYVSRESKDINVSLAPTELRTESWPLDLKDGGQEIFQNSLTKSLIAVGLPENDRKGFGHSKHGKLQEFYWEREERDEA